MTGCKNPHNNDTAALQQPGRQATAPSAETKDTTDDKADDSKTRGQNNGRGCHNTDAPEASETTNLPTRELLEALGTDLSLDLLVQALTHRSFSHEHPGAPNYERLEFLGDAVLEFVVTETLYTTHPEMNEGQLAQIRAKAVSEDSLSRIAREKLHVGPYILLGRGEIESGGAEKNSILCDIVESLIGATLIEHGINRARKVIHHLADDTLKKVATEGPALDWKTSLTVEAHDMGLGEPQYRMAVNGPEYAQVFTAKVIVDDCDQILGCGTGSSKRKAQLAAAEVAWKTLRARKEHSESRQSPAPYPNL